MSFSQRDAQLIEDCCCKPLDQLPANYVLIEQANIRATGEGADHSVPYIRLFKMDPIAPLPVAAGVASPSLKPVDK